ncbi:MAG: DUF2169 domain-containing protein [Myxococcales bacterium]|nr:DUF2169 domain-containing protein [Myxococcales bacterium]
MELTNHTRFPAGLARMVYGDDRIAASALVRVTYAREGRDFVAAAAQPWIVSMSPWEGPRGWMEGDLIFRKGGADVFLFGEAQAEGSRPTTHLEVGVEIAGGFSRRVLVHGRRLWRRRLGGLVPGAPEPFTSLPLTLANAFGGVDRYDDLAIAWPENPGGTGFYVDEASAVDRPLPAIEEIDQPVTRWSDRPPPAGLGPLPVGSPLRARHLEIEGGRPKLRPRCFNAAFAPMIADMIEPGAAVRLSGVSPRGPLHLELPRRCFALRLRFGGERHELPLHIDQVAFCVDDEALMIAYRSSFRYVVVPLQERACELVEVP